MLVHLSILSSSGRLLVARQVRMKTERQCWGVVLFLCAFVAVGGAIRCYECNSAINSQCALEKLPDSLKKNCSENRQREVTYTLCRKIVQQVEFPVNGVLPTPRVIRACGWDESKYKSTCYQRSGYGGKQEVCSCTTNDCNSGSSFNILIPLLITTLLALKVC